MNDRSDEMRQAQLEEYAAGLENLRAMFRQTMAASAPPEEPIEETRARIAADPATREVAKRLRCSVAELLEGLGEPQSFIVDEDYDHEAAAAQIDVVIQRVIDAPIGSSDDPNVGDRVEARALRHEGAHAAPHAEGPRGQIGGAKADAALVRRQMMTAAARPRMAAREMRRVVPK